MKKILSIALIVALVATSAFAVSYSGEAAIALGYDLDSTDYGFANSTSQTVETTINLESGEVAIAGEGDLKAELAAAFTIDVEIDEEDNTDNAADLAFDIAASAEITKANIIYKDSVTFGILGAGSSVTYAKAWAKAPTTQFDNVKAIKGVPGFTVTTADVKGGFGLAGNVDAETYAVLAWAATAKSIEVADGVKVDAAAATKITESAKVFQGAAKAAITMDEVSATVAVDAQYGEDLAMDIAATASAAGVTANVYVGTTDTFENIELDAKVAYALSDPKANVYAAIYQALDENARQVQVGGDVTIDAVKVEEAITYAIKTTAITSKTTVTYTADAYKVGAGLTVKVAEVADEMKVAAIQPSAYISSTKVVDKATLKLAYTGADFAEGVDKNGAITASATISF